MKKKRRGGRGGGIRREGTASGARPIGSREEDEPRGRASAGEAASGARPIGSRDSSRLMVADILCTSLFFKLQRFSPFYLHVL